MMPRMPGLRSPHTNRQRGVVLIVSLVLLLIMSILGVTAMQGSTLQERMTGNTRDRNLAFQAAEAALREAELLLNGAVLPDFTNADGFYQSSALNLPVWQGAGQAAGNGVLTYGGDLGDGLSRPPEYFIEELRDIIVPGTETETPPPPSNVSFYRITARGFGGTQNAVVVLSTIYRRD